MRTQSQELRQMEADLVKARRKAETAAKQHRAIAIDIVDKAGGFALSTLALDGLMDQARTADDKTLAALEAKGQAYRDRLALEAAKPKVLVNISFPQNSKGPKPREMPRELQWVKALECWMGKMNADDARALAKALGGTVKIDGQASLALAAE